MLDVRKVLESDLLSEIWGFLKTMTNGSKIITTGTECTSKGNSDVINRKRRISAVDPTMNRKMGHRVDNRYCTSDAEIGCIEIGREYDQTKEIKDSLVKMPLILHDMLLKLATTEKTLRQVHVLGYAIIGSKIIMLDMDSPKGYVARIRRSSPLQYPKSAEQYIPRIIPLLKLALSGFFIMERTRKAIDTTTYELQPFRAPRNWMPPPSFIPAELYSSSPPSPSSLSSLPPAESPISLSSSCLSNKKSRIE